MPKVLSTSVNADGGPHFEILAEAGFEVEAVDRSVDLFDEATLIGQMQGVSAISAGSEPYTAGVIGSLPDLRVISRSGVGFDAVDLAACDEHGVLLIFDEVMTGFRVAYGGAQQLYGVTPDLTTLGKIIGGGMPVGAYGGKEEIMNYVSPAGPVYQAGTLSGNPIAMSAGLAMLEYLNDHQEIYLELDKSGVKLAQGFRSSMEKMGVNYTINQIGSMYTLFFTDQPVRDFPSAKTSDLALYGRYFHAMLERGVYLGPSQFESMFLSVALEDKHIERVIQANEEALVEVLATV